MSYPVAAVGRTTAAIVALVVGSFLLLLALLGFIPRVFSPFGQYWSGRADIFTPRVPFIDSWAELGKNNGDAYGGLIFSSDAPLVASRWLTVAEGTLDQLVAITGSLLIVIIAIRVLMGRSFSKLARWGLVAFGALIMLDATLGPQFAPLASDLALQELGYPIAAPDSVGAYTENSPELVSLALWDPIWVANRFDFTQLMLGIVVLLFGSLTRDGLKLQKDAEGLV